MHDVRRRRSAWPGVFRWALLVLAFAATATAAPPDPREAAVRAQLDGLEALVRTLDGGRATGTTQVARVADLQRRVVALERRLGLVPGVVSLRSDLASLLADTNELGRRVRRVLVARAAAAGGPPGEPSDGVFVPKPPDPGSAPATVPPPTGPSAEKVQFPTTLRFRATGKLHIEPTGEWFAAARSWGPDFLQTGTQGTLSLSVRAQGLTRTARSADLRLVARVGSPFFAGGSGVRVIDITMKSERELNNGALRTWAAADRFSVPGPYGWISDTKPVNRDVDVEAHVRSVTLLDGTTFHFLVPEFVHRRR